MSKTVRNIILIVVAVLLVAGAAVVGLFVPIFQDENQQPITGLDYLSSLMGGQEDQVTGEALQVSTVKFMPYAYLNEAFDLREQVLLPEEGVEYSATACYVVVSRDSETNAYSIQEYALDVKDLCFTPQVIAETVVTLTAKRGDETASKVVYIPTTIRAEPLDDLYKSSGSLGGSDAGISKSVNIDPLYLQGDNSTTSLHVEFSGVDAHSYGNIFLDLCSPDAQQYFTDQVWDNAILTFWVYNPNDKAIEFQLRICDPNAGTNLDWNTVDGPHKQFAQPGQWTQIFFSLRKLGTKNKLTTNKFTTDLMLLKFRYEEYSTSDNYSFDFYMDNIDVVPATMYPDIDTKYVLSDESIEQGWENMIMDIGWQGVYTEYDYENIMGEVSTCSLKATFPGDKGKTNSFICLHPEAEFAEDPDMTGGKLSGYFKFENMDAKVSLDLVNQKWEISNKVDFSLKEVGDGWYYGEINLEDVQVGSGRNDGIIRIRLHFYGVTDESVVYTDTLIYDYKYVDKVLESVSADWINLPSDRGDYYCNVETQYVTNYLKGSNTVRSLMIQAPANAAGKFTFDTAAAVTYKELSAEPDMRKGTLGAWFYFGKQLPNASMRVTSDSWKGSTALPFVFTQNSGDGWYYGELHGSDIIFSESADASKIIRITIDIPKGYTVYMDNLKWTAGVENNLTAAEIDPTVLYDGGDLLAGTDSIIYNKTHWENIPNTDDFDGDGVIDSDVAAGLTCGVDTSNIYGQYSVRSWYFKAKASNNLGIAIAQLQLSKAYDMTGKLFAFDIRIDSDSKIQQSIGFRLHGSDWANFNDNNLNIKLNSDETWKTVVLDFSDVFKSDADLSKLGFISIYFDFAANTGKDRAIYIDNVRLIKPEEIPADAVTADEIPETPDPSDMYDGGDLFANAKPASGDMIGIFNGSGNFSYDKQSTMIYTENEVGQYSVKSWMFSSVSATDVYPTALIDLGRSVNMNGKALAMDVYFENTDATFAVYTLHDTGWLIVNASESAANYVKNGTAGQWNTFYFDISKKLAEGKNLSDVHFIKLQFFFEGTDGDARKVYVDNVRLVDPSLVPPEDDTSVDWTNMVQDQGSYYHNMVTNEFSTDYTKGGFSTQSLHVVAPADVAGRFTFHTEYAVTKGELEKQPNMNAGTLGAWFYFGDQTPAATLSVTESNWSTSSEVNFVFGEGEDGWYYGTLDCTQLEYGKSFYPGLAIRVTVGIPAGYDVYIDSMTFEPADIADPGELAEDPGDLLGSVKFLEYNEEHWTASTGLTVKPNTEMVYTEEFASIRSMSFLATSAAKLENACAQFKLAESVNMTGYNLAFEIFYDADTKVQQKIGVRLHNGSGDITSDEFVNVNAGKWKTVIINFDDVLLAGKNYSDLKLISFYFDFSANTGVERKVYIDNVRLTKENETRDDEPAPADPSELYDGGDLLANATVEWDPALWDGDPGTADGNCTEIFNGNDMGAYSVKSWKFSTLEDNYVESIQLKLNNNFSLVGKNLVFDVKFVNAGQTVGIELFNGWYGLQPDNTAMVTLHGDGSDGWQTFVISAEELYAGIGDQAHDNIAMIRFHLNFTSEASGEHAVYIDNLRVTQSDFLEIKSDMLGNAEIAAPDWTNENGLSATQDTENTTGPDSFRSWAFKASADVTDVAVAVFELKKNVDMTGKYLVFDAKTNADQLILIQLFDENGEALTDAMLVTLQAGKWSEKLVAMETEVLESKNLSAVRYVAFAFDYASNTGADRAAYIDNVTLIDGETVADDLIHLDKTVGNGVASLDGSILKAEDSIVSLKLVAPVDALGIVTLDMSGLDFTLKHRGTLNALFYFGDQEPYAAAALIESGMNVTTEDLVFAFESVGDGWYKGTINLSDAIYAEGVNRGYVAYVAVGVKAGYTVYIDGLTYADITETADLDMIQIPHDKGTISTDVVYGDNSVQSLYVEAASSAINLTFTPAQALSFADGKLTAWFYFGDKAPSQVRFAAYSGSTNTGYLNFSFGEGVDGWYLGTVDMAGVAANKQNVLKSVTKFVVQVRAGSNTYIDNMVFVPNDSAE